MHKNTKFITNRIIEKMKACPVEYRGMIIYPNNKIKLSRINLAPNTNQGFPMDINS